jgi:antitoxin (DNA-binding transcriptional repressor) of toxin-antitoxin stability system
MSVMSSVCWCYSIRNSSQTGGAEMREMGMAQVRKDLSQLIDDIRMTGEPIIIKDYKREVAMLVPIELAKEFLKESVNLSLNRRAE